MEEKKPWQEESLVVFGEGGERLDGGRNPTVD